MHIHTYIYICRCMHVAGVVNNVAEDAVGTLILDTFNPCTYICIHTYTYIYIHIHTYTYVYIHIHGYIHTYTYI